MTDARQALRDTKRHIVDYLQRHPCAADGVRGIGEWWLEGYADVDIAVVEQALDELLVEGRVLRVVLPDGSALYMGPSSGPANDRARP